MDKITKREAFEQVIALVNQANSEGLSIGDEYDYEGIIAIMEKEIKNLDKKAEDSRKRAKDKKEKGDALRDKIYDILPEDEFMTTPQIISNLDEADLSPQKVSARCAALVKLGKIEKSEVAVPGADGKSRRLMGYRKVVNEEIVPDLDAD